MRLQAPNSSHRPHFKYARQQLELADGICLACARFPVAHAASILQRTPLDSTMAVYDVLRSFVTIGNAVRNCVFATCNYPWSSIFVLSFCLAPREDLLSTPHCIEGRAWLTDVHAPGCAAPCAPIRHALDQLLHIADCSQLALIVLEWAS